MLSSLRHSGSTPPYIFHLHYKQHSICDAGKVGSFDKTILNYEKSCCSLQTKLCLLPKTISAVLKEVSLTSIICVRKVYTQNMADGPFYKTAAAQRKEKNSEKKSQSANFVRQVKMGSTRIQAHERKHRTLQRLK